MTLLSIKRVWIKHVSIKRTARAAAIAGAIATGLTMTATTAGAGSITFSDTLSAGSASIQKFDTALGTLDKVRIRYDINVSVSALFLNPSFTPGTATLLSNRLRLNGRDRDIFDSSLPFKQITSQALGEDIPIPAAFAIPGSTTVIPGTARPVFGIDYDATFDSDGLGINPGTFFSFDTGLFEGTDDFDFDFTATLDSPLTFTGFQPFLPSSQPILSGTVTVTYEFTETVAQVPTPAALPVLAAGLAAFGLLRRRKARG